MKTKYKITLFHCINAFRETPAIKAHNGRGFEIKTIKIACSGMTKDIFLLKAFEAGADAVLVLACPESSCRYAEGGIRAGKRVQWVKNLLDEIGLNGKRLSLHNVSLGDDEAVGKILTNIYHDLDELGPNPAAKKNCLNRTCINK